MQDVQISEKILFSIWYSFVVFGRYRVWVMSQAGHSISVRWKTWCLSSDFGGHSFWVVLSCGCIIFGRQEEDLDKVLYNMYLLLAHYSYKEFIVYYYIGSKKWRRGQTNSKTQMKSLKNEQPFKCNIRRYLFGVYKKTHLLWIRQNFRNKCSILIIQLTARSLIS